MRGRSRVDGEWDAQTTGSPGAESNRLNMWIVGVLAPRPSVAAAVRRQVRCASITVISSGKSESLELWMIGQSQFCRLPCRPKSRINITVIGIQTCNHAPGCSLFSMTVIRSSACGGCYPKGGDGLGSAKQCTCRRRCYILCRRRPRATERKSHKAQYGKSREVFPSGQLFLCGSAGFGPNPDPAASRTCFR